MSEQLEQAIRLTQARIDELEGELRREREFMARLVPKTAKRSRPASNGSRWLEVFAAIAEKPLRHEHIIDLIEERQFPMSRGSTRVWLNDKSKRGYLKRNKSGFYAVTQAGQQWLKASSSPPAS